MPRLSKSLNAWGTPDFVGVLKEEIAQLDAGQLPLRQGLSVGSHVLDNKPGVMIIGISDDAEYIHVRAGIFYSSILAGCSCADDPTPVNENSEYCEVRFDIDKKTAETTVNLLAE